MRRGILLLICWLLLASACQEDSLKSSIETMQRDLPDESSVNVKLSQFDHERLEYIIEAERMERYTDRRLLYAYAVTLVSYNKDGLKSSVIQADTVMVDDARNLIFAMGNARYKADTGQIETQKIVWERTLDEITAPAHVVFRRPGETLRGSNLRTDSRLSYAELESVSAEGIIHETDFDW